MTNTSSVPWEKSVSWPDHLRDALEDANIPTLLLVLHHLTGSDRWISEPYRPSRGKPLDDNDTGGLGADLQAEVRDAAWEAVMAYREGRLQPVTPSPKRVTEMMSCALVDDVPVEYGELLSEEMGFLSRDIAVPESAVPDDFFVVVIGAGLSGLCMAIKLAATGIRFVIVEKARAASGTR